MSGTIASLNVRIGADIKNLQRDLDKAKRELRQSTKDFAEIGKNLTLGISLPLVGLGSMAVKTAGEVESLRLAMRTTFQDAGRSIQEADAEMEALRQSAMAPGLDFPQAIKASIRLQNVGMKAESARKTIQELANTISMSGGTAEDLDSVTGQLAQMISKGKILAGDLRIIQERMPKISGLMQEAFGTSNSEKLQEMGVTGEEFITKMTEKMSTLPRVAGGINNSIVNLGAGVSNFLTSIGEDINKSFNLQQKFDNLADWLTGIAKGFADLDVDTKKTILTFGAFAAAIGPAVYVLTEIFQVIGRVQIIYKNLVGSIEIASKSLQLWQAQVAAGEISMSRLSMGIKAVGLAFKNMDAITKASTIGIFVAAIGTAVLAFKYFTKELSAAEKAQLILKDVNAEAAKSIVAERLEAERLTATLKKETASREQKEAALTRLKEINNSYFGDLDIEKSKITDIDAALQNYIGSIEKRARVTAANQKLIAIEKELFDLSHQPSKSEPTFWQKTGNAILAAGDIFAMAAANTRTFTKNLLENRNALELQKKALLDVIATSEIPQYSTSNKKTNTNGDCDSTGKSKRNVRKLVSIPDLLPSTMDMEKSVTELAAFIERNIEKTVPRVQTSGEMMKNALTQLGESFDIIDNKAAVFGDAFSPIEEKIKATEAAIMSLLENGANPFGNDIQTMMELLAGMKTQIDENIISFQWFDKMLLKMSESNNFLVTAFDAAGQSMVDVAATGETSFKKLGIAALKSAADVVRAALMKFVATTIEKTALASGPLAPFVAPAAGILAGVLFNKAISALKIPAFADGGLVTAPTLAMVGDNRSGTEAIIPLEKMGNFFNGGNSNIHLTGDVRWSGREFVIAFEQANKSMDRIRGPK
jgi:tape measure domain-containing protein